MKTKQSIILMAAALLAGLLNSCEDDPITPNPNSTDTGDEAFSYTEVWQYITDEDEEGQRDTVSLYCNMGDSTYLCQVAKHTTDYILQFHDGEYGSLQIRTVTYGYSDEDREGLPTLLLQREGADEAQYFMIRSYEFSRISLQYNGFLPQPIFPYYVTDYTFRKIQSLPTGEPVSPIQTGDEGWLALKTELDQWEGSDDLTDTLWVIDSAAELANMCEALHISEVPDIDLNGKTLVVARIALYTSECRILGSGLYPSNDGYRFRVAIRDSPYGYMGITQKLTYGLYSHTDTHINLEKDYIYTES